MALRPGGGEQGDRRSIMQLGAPIGQYRYSHGGAGGEKWDFFVIFWYCLDLPGRSLSKLVRDRADLDDEFLGLVSPGLMLVEKKAAVCSSKPGRLPPMVKSRSVE